MARGVQPAHSSPRTRSSWERGWLDLDKYVVVHERYLDVLARDGYVDDVSLTFTKLTAPDGSVRQVKLEGIVFCPEGVAVEVTKYMETRYVEGRLQVISTYYRYHAWRPGRSGEPLIRYDQAHDSDHPHYHRFDSAGEPLRYDDLTLETMPRLDAVVREAVDLARERDSGPS